MTLADLVLNANTGADAIKKAPIVNEDTGLRCLRIGDVSQKRDYEEWGFTKTTEADYERYKLEIDDLIIARTGNTIGVNCIIEDNLNSVYNNGLIRIKADTSKVIPRYLWYMISSKNCQDFVQSIAYGTSTQPNMKINDFLRYSFEYQDLDIQKRIVEIIDPIEKKIKANTAINRNLYEQAITIFEQVYQTYQTAKIGDTDVFVTDYVANGSFKSLKENVTILEDKDYAYFIRNVDLKAKSFPRFVDQHSYEFLSKSKLEGGEVIISNVVDVGSVFLCPKLDGPMTLGNNMIMLKSEKHNNYLYLYFMSYIGQGMIDGITGGSAQPKFNKTDFKSLEINYPSDKEVEDFNSKVAPLLNLIGCVDMENQRLQALRDTLLPKLMSGELDVSGLEI